MVNIWKSTNVRFKDRLEELKSAKETLKASNKELIDYIRAMLGRLGIVPVDSVSTSTFDLEAEENKKFLLKLHQARHFRKIGWAWIEDLKARVPLIENIGNLILDADRLREAISAHQISMQIE